MLLEEFDVEKYERTLKSEGREEGISEGIEAGREQGIRCMIEALQEAGQTEKQVAAALVTKYSLSEGAAKEKLSLYWK